jgi:hypothetical protein
MPLICVQRLFSDVSLQKLRSGHPNATSRIHPPRHLARLVKCNNLQNIISMSHGGIIRPEAKCGESVGLPGEGWGRLGSEIGQDVEEWDRMG